MNLFITVYINWECVLKILAIRLLLMNWALKSSCHRLRKLGTSNKKEKERKKRKKNGSICMTKQGWPHCGEEGGLAGVSADTEGLTGRRNGGIYCETPSSISNPPPPAPPTPTLHPRHLGRAGRAVSPVFGVGVGEGSGMDIVGLCPGNGGQLGHEGHTFCCSCCLRVSPGSGSLTWGDNGPRRAVPS